MTELRHTRWLDRLLDIGTYPGETEIQSGRRRVMVGALGFSLPLIGLSALVSLSDGHVLVALTVAGQVLVHGSALIALTVRPRAIVAILGVVFAYDLIGEVVVSYLYGGLYLSSVTVIWSLIAVLGALLIFSVRAASIWFLLFAGSVVAAGLMDGRVEPRYVGTEPVFDAVVNLLGATLLTFVVIAYFVRQRDRFQARSDDLLHNILPHPIALRLKDSETLIADDIDEVSVLFADVVGFTPLSASLEADELISLLNSVFSLLDSLADEFGLEKIKTVGDEYMVAAGVPTSDPDHAAKAADLALRIQEAVASSDFEGHRIEMRIGISSGPVVAGVIGTAKFAYDLWGATVNTASRMESSGVPGRVQVSAATRELLGSDFVCTPRGTIDVKGLGEMETYFLESRSV